MNQVLYNILVLLILLTTLLFISLKRPFSDKVFIINTYGYIALALLLVSFVIVYFNSKNIDLTIGKILLSFLVVIICIFTFHRVHSPILKHITWLVFVLNMGVLLYPTYKKSAQDGTVLKVLLTTILLFVLLSIYVFFSKQSTFTSWGGYLTFALFSLILVELVDIFFFKKFTDGSFKSTQKKLKIYGIITVVLFSGFILYDTDVLRQRSKHITTPDYPTESISLFLDILNLFSGLVSSSN